MKPIYDYLPSFDYIEPNTLKALQPGFVVSQMPVAESAKATLCKDLGTSSAHDYYMENGTICAISVDGIVAPTTDTKTLFICFSDPLLRVKDHDKFFAVSLEEEDPRLVQLIPGDEWMATKALTLTGALAGRIVEVTATSGQGKSDDWYAQSKMADGTAGHHYMFLG